MEVMRLFDLVTEDGGGIMDMDEDPLGLKDALYYLNEKTEKWTDEEFLDWLKVKRIEGPFSTTELIMLGQDIFTPEFSFLQKKKIKLMGAISELIDQLVVANKLG